MDDALYSETVYICFEHIHIILAATVSPLTLCMHQRSNIFEMPNVDHPHETPFKLMPDVGSNHCAVINTISGKCIKMDLTSMIDGLTGG